MDAPAAMTPVAPDPASSEPLVTVVIPCFNSEAFVGSAIESALNQTYRRLEVVVVDDGSTDGSLDIVRSFGSSVRFESGPNRGGSAARNRGLRLAEGALVQFLDADDLLLPEKLARQVPCLMDGVADLVFCDGETSAERDPDTWTAGRLAFENGTTDPVVFCLRGRLQTPSPLHRRENLQRVGGFRADLPCAQERDLHLRLACRGLSFTHLPEILYRVRDRSDSVSSDYLRVLDQHASVFGRAWDVLEEAGTLTEARRIAFAHAMASDANNYVQRGHPQEARHYYRLARGMHARGSLTAFHPALRPLARVAPVAAARLTTWKRRTLRQ